MGPLPDGWKGCPEIANELIDSTFVTFKTPVEHNQNSTFTLKTVFDCLHTRQWNLGLWIDLTNTNKYFSGKSVEERGVQYIKMKCIGQQSPSRFETEKFIGYCRTFLVQNPGKIIGVHCTHGFNRTGFLICAYLNIVNGYKAHEALQKFAAVRPPGIYRQNLVDDFVMRYSKSGEPAPPNVSVLRIPWKEQKRNVTMPAIVGLNLEATTKIRKPRMTKEEKRKRLLAQCPIDCRENYSIPFQSYLAMRPEVEALDSTRQWNILNEIKSFGLANSQSNSLVPPTMVLTQENFNFLKTSDEIYTVSWCPQEYFPYLLYIDAEGRPYMVNSDNVVLPVPTLLFPDVAIPTKNLYSTILKGFIVTRKRSPDDVTGCFCFEIIDMITLRGININTTDYKSREYGINSEIIRAREHLRKREDYLKEPFLIRQKNMWAMHDFAKMQTYPWLDNYTVPPNGLIFYPPINSGITPTLQWSSPQTNSAYFRLSLDVIEGASETSSDFNPVIRADDYEQPLQLKVTAEDKAILKRLNGRIIECQVKMENNCKSWRFKREATRRTYSDSYSTVKCIWEGLIAHNVQMKEVFVDFLALKKSVPQQQYPLSRNFRHNGPSYSNHRSNPNHRSVHHLSNNHRNHF